MHVQPTQASVSRPITESPIIENESVHARAPKIPSIRRARKLRTSVTLRAHHRYVMPYHWRSRGGEIPVNQCDEFRQTKQVGVLEWSQTGCVAIPSRRSDIWDRPAGHAAGGWGGLPDTSQQDVQG